MTTVDVAVIGGGIVGLAIADAWLTKFPNARILVLEKESDVGQHASGRNSGVLHAGFYYTPDSLKAKLTRQGNMMLRDFCARSGIPVRDTGKVVVTRTEEEIPALLELANRGNHNGVPLEIVNEQELRRLEPLARTAQSALWSPTTAVADPVLVMTSLLQNLQRRGVSIHLNSRVSKVEPGRVTTSTGATFFAGHIVNAAGLHADKIAHAFGEALEYSILPFKGLYWYLNWPAGRLTRHVYPVPDPRNPFLGVHLTVTSSGLVKVGPTATPALWREAYDKCRNFNFGEFTDIASTYPRFLFSKHHDVPRLICEEVPKYLKSAIVKQATSLVPSVAAQDFDHKGRTGVRAQLYHSHHNRLEMDFVVLHSEGRTHILNAVSPGWTSAFAFAAHVIQGILLR